MGVLDMLAWGSGIVESMGEGGHCQSFVVVNS